MCMGGTLFLQLIILSMEQFTLCFNLADYLDLKVADIAISLS